MSDAATDVRRHELAFEAFGVRIGVTANDAGVLARVRDFMPPGSRPCDSVGTQHRFEITSHDDGARFELQMNDEWLVDYEDLDLALGLLEMHMTGYIAVHAPDRIFVHAGVVSHRDRVLVMPGLSFAGKSSLVAALMRAGATYYSDEFAVLDEDGRVHPYPRRLSLRGEFEKPTSHTAESLGGTIGDEPRVPAVIVMTTYRPGAEWSPRRLSSGEGTLEVFSNTVPARERPQEALRAITRAVEGAVVLKSERGEADSVAPLLLAELER